ncbi:hypothetical protein HU200_030795 [Digitaria exilis]|uniref:F-box domain-containing protein n=1 Tax=Digitaria exilis TaxID=1010633 RepID=A0A835BWQ6_9POAL|nr:hypothetical protein HU200_030795 [Digitaria exilis]CAB3459332.1 unnamed protein product [Digitaria exilis]
MASSATSPQRNCRLAPPRRLHHDELLVDEILTRLPVAAAVRFRLVCRAWNKALTSDHFLKAHHARLAAARQPELLFLLPPPAANGTAASLYACSLRDGEPPSAARELLTIGNLSSGEHVLILSSPRPCHGLTLILDARHCFYYICNVSTRQHAALPPCEPAMCSPAGPSRIGMGFHLRPPPWTPFEISTAGLGFNHATGQHKVVRLFKTRIGETICAVCALGRPAGWRPCAGRVPPAAASFIAGLPPVFIDGSLYWLLDNQLDTTGGQPPAIMSLSVDDEQFGFVRTPPLLSRRICHLTDLDGSLCATVDLRHVAERYAIFTWSGGGGSTSWSVRCSINLQRLPRPIADEFVEEQDVVPLCSAGAGGNKKILLATGRHKVFAYDPERDSMERLVYMLEFVDIPRRHREAPLLLNISLHEERIACVHDPTPSDCSSSSSKRRLHFRPGNKTLGKRQVPSNDYHDDRFRHLRDLFKEMAGLPLPHMNI